MKFVSFIFFNQYSDISFSLIELNSLHLASLHHLHPEESLADDDEEEADDGEKL